MEVQHFPRAWSPGAGTARALREAGWPRALIDQPVADAAQFDSESLWAQVAPQVQPGARVLVVRGTDEDGQGRGRDWLARQIEAAGGSVDYAQAYRRAAPAPTPDALALARAALHDGSVWLLSSSQAVAHLRGWLPHEDFSRAHALTTHPRIAQAARAAGFGRVDGCRPLVAEVVRALRAFPSPACGRGVGGEGRPQAGSGASSNAAQKPSAHQPSAGPLPNPLP